MDSLSKIIDYIDKCSFDELGLIHKIAGDRFHQLKYKDEIEKEEQMRRSLSVGDQVSWSSNKIPAQKETRIQGIVIRLNPKTATIATKKHGQWLVAYGFLTKEGSYKTETDFETQVIEGEIVEETDENSNSVIFLKSANKRRKKKKKKTKKVKRKKRKRGKKK